MESSPGRMPRRCSVKNHREASSRGAKGAQGPDVDGVRPGGLDGELLFVIVPLHRRVIDPVGLTLGPHEGEDVGDLAPEVLAVHNAVDHPVLEQELAGLESLGEVGVDGLLDHPWSREADERLWLGEDDVSEHRVARGDAARRGVGENRDVGQPVLGDAREHGRGLGQLHEGQN